MLSSPINSHPYFEEARCWGKEISCSFVWQYLPKEKQAEFKSALEQGNSTYFHSLSTTTLEDVRYCQISYYASPTQALDTVYLSVQNVKIKTNRKGNSDKKTKFIVKNLLVSSTFVTELETTASESFSF